MTRLARPRPASLKPAARTPAPIPRSRRASGIDPFPGCPDNPPPPCGCRANDHRGRPCLPCHHSQSVLPWTSFRICPPASAQCCRARVPACWSTWPGWRDPRDPRGVRHTLTSLLVTAVAAVLTGTQSFAAVGEWIADAPPQVLACLGVRRDPPTGGFEPRDEATIRQILEAVDAAALDAAVGSWLATQLRAGNQGQGRRPRAVAVDGEAVRGTRHASREGQPVHLLAAADQQAGAVLAQTDVDGKTNEVRREALCSPPPSPSPSSSTPKWQPAGDGYPGRLRLIPPRLRICTGWFVRAGASSVRRQRCGGVPWRRGSGGRCRSR